MKQLPYEPGGKGLEVILQRCREAKDYRVARRLIVDLYSVPQAWPVETNAGLPPTPPILSNKLLAALLRSLKLLQRQLLRRLQSIRRRHLDIRLHACPLPVRLRHRIE
jgi:hypothetical protein